ncbi:aspartate/glutamate racemase family protein [Sphingosinicella microcystinivorans]|uniref:aspartate/glutamate racemase family protein n=1 Tax=Sphingosinicella microcystinivorans TaxID=335406 RepID=UPI0022F3F7F2|nr:aspartate/glutamate racemase family protein [Sphingosinicella microcystinivorans]WBX86455.1 aspartate/glutamate racemase family protein [Sphingosinicella microcystinivorans]
MRTIGLIGGMSWESTALYYRIINEGIRDRLGGLNSAKLLLCSVNFAELERLQHEERWEEAAAILLESANALERAGADFILLCTNTMHLVADTLAGGMKRPLLHIADATGEAIRAAGISKVGLLGTRFTMERDFYAGRLRRRHGIDVIIPEQAARETIHRIIYDELCQGQVRAGSRDAYLEIVQALVSRGAEAVILGCTEIGLLLGPGDTNIPLFDTTRIHAEAAVRMALA